MDAHQFRHCPQCGAEAVSVERDGRDRRHCRSCGRTWYRNPTTGVAVILIEQERLLLGRRARGRFQGQWCIPCGHVEWDEEIRAAARREFREETGLEVEVGDVYTAHSNFHDEDQHTVGVWFLGRTIGGALSAGDDLDAVAFLALGDRLPDLAFPTDHLVIQQLRLDLARGRITGSGRMTFQ